MTYYTNQLFPFSDLLSPQRSFSYKDQQVRIMDMRLAGIGTMSPTIGTRFAPGLPPQQTASPMLTHPVSHSHGADCPTCDLVEIPYDPNLPHLQFSGA